MTIIKETMLILVSATANSNKFYHVTLSDAGQVAKRYGRVGTDGVTNVENTGEAGYNRVIAGKMKKGYKETNIVSESEVASKDANLSEIAKKVLLGDKGTNSVLDELVDTLVRLNNHDILETSGGLIKVNSDGLMTTPLGLINQQSINAAKSILGSLERTPVNNTRFVPLLEEYLGLIPQKVGSKRGWYETFFNDENTFASQADFLKQLGESLTLREERKKAALEASKAAGGDKAAADALDAKYEKLFKLKIGLLEDEKEFKRIERMFESGKSMHHPGARYKLKRVFALDDPDGLAVYDKTLKELGNEQELWHGTRIGNVLSILRSGLYCPDPRTSKIQIQGRLFGDGIYQASSIVKGGSSKAMNYSAGGVWDRGPRDTQCFMFLTKSVLGREYHPNSYGYANNSVQSSGNYDSIYAHARMTGLQNDEIIIWNTDQISMRYLCEFGV